MKFGVNYTPSQGWFYGWLDFNRDAIARDLEAIAGIGIDHVRVFPIWPFVQPNRGLVREQAVADLVTLVNTAGEVGLDVSVDMLQGHMSSFDFLPNWVTDWHGRTMFSDPDVIDGQQYLVRTLTQALHGLPNMTGINVGNEIVQFAASRHPARHVITPDEAGTWLQTMFTTINKIWPEGIHSHSFDDDLFFDDTQPFLPVHATELGDITTVHSWVFGRVGQKFGPNHEALPWFARYICELAAGWDAQRLNSDTPRKIWLQEVGAPLSYIEPTALPSFITETICNLVDPASTTGASGTAMTPLPDLDAITWWCSHDVNRALLDFPELEHTLGLFDTHGELKPTGKAYQEMIQRYKDFVAPTGTVERPHLDMTVRRDGSDRSATDPRGYLFAQWYEAVCNGHIPAIHLHQS